MLLKKTSPRIYLMMLNVIVQGDCGVGLWCGTLGSVDINKAEKGGAALYSFTNGQY